MIRAALLIIMLALAASMDYTDTVASESEYAAMVCAGHWPDYDKLEPVCNEN